MTIDEYTNQVYKWMLTELIWKSYITAMPVVVLQFYEAMACD